jgi:hypothetical protein
MLYRTFSEKYYLHYSYLDAEVAMKMPVTLQLALLFFGVVPVTQLVLLYSVKPHGILRSSIDRKGISCSIHTTTAPPRH